jgi:hypothetical protein
MLMFLEATIVLSRWKLKPPDHSFDYPLQQKGIEA